MQNQEQQTPHKKAPRWSVQDLVVIGVFSAAAKISTMLVALMGGGPNPVGLMAKNLIFTTMLVVMMYKVRVQGTMLLFICINMIISMLLLGASVTLLPAMLLAGIMAEAAVLGTGGMQRSWGPILAVAVYDLTSKLLSIGTSWLFMRENVGMVVMIIPIVAIGYVGSLAGLFTGKKAVKELQHAGIIR
ncbi:MAG: MptD family putative ECF transporter S component [Pseudomonadota bacterium]